MDRSGKDGLLRVTMRMNRCFDEIRVYAGVAERTGAQFQRDAVRRSEGFCRSLTELIRKARASGDGIFYLPLDQWPADRENVEVHKPWVGMSSHP
jgi:hypothetical protein